jgi:CRP-like cAMP-binding protein
MLNIPSELHHNYLLRALPPAELQRLTPHLRLTRLAAGKMLFDSGEPIKSMYFPTTAVLSLLCLMEDGASVEVAAVSRNGVAGVPVLMGGQAMPSRMEVCVEGYAYVIDANLFKCEFSRSDAIRNLMLLYIQALMTQIAQSALCNRRHSVDEQLCRWLLLAHDRMQNDSLVTTQQLIANSIGVRREGITEAAGKLEAAGLILRHRGRITVLDRTGLECRTCECYGVIKREFQRLLPRCTEESPKSVLERGRPAAALQSPHFPCHAAPLPAY